MAEEEPKKIVEEKVEKKEETSKDVTQEKSVDPVSDHKDSDSRPPAADESNFFYTCFHILLVYNYNYILAGSSLQL